jgi:diacylglycerol kinase family enzyme
MGTANNLTNTLSIKGKPLDIIARLERPHKHKIDLGHVEAPWGEDYFIEGAGLGFFAQALAAYDPEKGKSVTRSVKSIVEVFQEGFGQRTTIRLPEEEISTEFLLVEILNTCAVGPRLKFAPDADPTDGLLHVVCIDGEKKESYFRYMRSLLTEEIADMPSVNVYKVQSLEIGWNGFPFHIDDYVRPFDFDYHNKKEELFPLRRYPDVPDDATIRVEVLPQALNIWLPKPEDGNDYTHKN